MCAMKNKCASDKSHYVASSAFHHPSIRPLIDSSRKSDLFWQCVITIRATLRQTRNRIRAKKEKRRRTDSRWPGHVYLQRSCLERVKGVASELHRCRIRLHERLLFKRTYKSKRLKVLGGEWRITNFDPLSV